MAVNDIEARVCENLLALQKQLVKKLIWHAFATRSIDIKLTGRSEHHLFASDILAEPAQISIRC